MSGEIPKKKMKPNSSEEISPRKKVRKEKSGTKSKELSKQSGISIKHDRQETISSKEVSGTDDKKTLNAQTNSLTSTEPMLSLNVEFYDKDYAKDLTVKKKNVREEETATVTDNKVTSILNELQSANRKKERVNIPTSQQIPSDSHEKISNKGYKAPSEINKKGSSVAAILSIFNEKEQEAKQVVRKISRPVRTFRDVEKRIQKYTTKADEEYGLKLYKAPEQEKERAKNLIELHRRGSTNVTNLDKKKIDDILHHQQGSTSNISLNDKKSARYEKNMGNDVMISQKVSANLSNKMIVSQKDVFTEVGKKIEKTMGIVNEEGIEENKKLMANKDEGEIIVEKKRNKKKCDDLLKNEESNAMVLANKKELSIGKTANEPIVESNNVNNKLHEIREVIDGRSPQIKSNVSIKREDGMNLNEKGIRSTNSITKSIYKENSAEKRGTASKDLSSGKEIIGNNIDNAADDEKKIKSHDGIVRTKSKKKKIVDNEPGKMIEKTILKPSKNEQTEFIKKEKPNLKSEYDDNETDRKLPGFTHNDTKKLVKDIANVKLIKKSEAVLKEERLDKNNENSSDKKKNRLEGKEIKSKTVCEPKEVNQPSVKRPPRIPSTKQPAIDGGKENKNEQLKDTIMKNIRETTKKMKKLNEKGEGDASSSPFVKVCSNLDISTREGNINNESVMQVKMRKCSQDDCRNRNNRGSTGRHSITVVISLQH